MPWLRFFRIVNLPTVPGDVLVGAGVAGGFCSAGTVDAPFPWGVLAASVAASCALYLYGLADNDIVGAKSDGVERPIPAGEISLGAARIARAACLLVAIVIGLVANLPTVWWTTALVLLGLEIAYNRFKWCVLMGLCRGVNVLCGAVAWGQTPWGQTPLAIVTPWGQTPWSIVGGVMLVWTAYIAFVTKYSTGESEDPAKRRCVGQLIGAHIYLQLFALFVTYWLVPTVFTRNLLLLGAGLLIVLRVAKRMLPKVSAS